MDPCIKITKKFTKKSGSKVINRQYFYKKTGLQCSGQRISLKQSDCPILVCDLNISLASEIMPELVART